MSGPSGQGGVGLLWSLSSFLAGEANLEVDEHQRIDIQVHPGFRDKPGSRSSGPLAITRFVPDSEFKSDTVPRAPVHYEIRPAAAAGRRIVGRAEWWRSCRRY